jgi:hypothetical protein
MSTVANDKHMVGWVMSTVVNDKCMVGPVNVTCNILPPFQNKSYILGNP